MDKYCTYQQIGYPAQFDNEDYRGTLKSTLLKWLPVLSNIVPPNIRREQTLIREWIRIVNNPILPIHMDLKAIEGRM